MPEKRILPAVLRRRDIEAREVLRQRLETGSLQRVARGIYLTPAAARSKHRDLLIVGVRAPNAVICLLSALAFHGLTSQMPHEVWIAIGLKSRRPAIDTPPIRVVRLSEKQRAAGIEIHEVLGVPLRVYSAAKTVADCFKFRSKVGTDVALAALREGWSRRRFTMDELWRYAVICRVGGVIRPYLEALEG